MEKFYKSQDFFLTNLKELHNLLYGKSKYLKNLVKRKNESYNSLTNKKIEMIKDKLIRANKFERDYSIFSKEKLVLKPLTTRKSKMYFSPDIRPLILSPEEAENPKRYKKKVFDTDNFSLIYKETNSSKYSKTKPIIVLNTSSFSKLNQKGRYKENKTNGGNCFIDFEDRKNFEFPNNSINFFYNNSSQVLNNSNGSNYTSSFLTSVGNNVVINKIKNKNPKK